MAFFKNLFASIRNIFGGDDNERIENGLAKQRDTLSAYQHSVEPHAPAAVPSEAPNETIKNDNNMQTIVTSPQPLISTTPSFTEVSDIIEHEIQDIPVPALDILVDALGLNRKKIVCDRGVVSIPFDASGCDFETKRQIAQAVAQEFNLSITTLPSSIACTEAAKRTFSSIKAVREESFVCGTMLIAINQDIDDEGYMLAEVTNTHNGNAVFFDIPATITTDGSVDVNYDLIVHNILIARDKTL